MIVLAERTSMPLRARLVECDCDDPDCKTVFVVMQLVGAHDDLWLAIGMSFLGGAAAADSIDVLLDDPCRDLGHYTFQQMIERGMALVGLTWDDYLSRALTHQVFTAQIRAWTALPAWMERMPAGKLWALRGAVFGRPLTRMPRALYAEAKSYVPEQPRAYDDFEQDLAWGLEVVNADLALVRTLKDVPVPAAVLLNLELWDS